jgi:type IV secretion system protein VirB10
MLTEAVTDVLGQGVELLPQGALLIGKQQGATQYGDSRLPLAIDEAQFPDGTVVAFTQAKVGDSRGAAALEGSVNNHYGKLAAGVFATAALSIGTRAAAGNTASFQQTYQQEFARDVSANINQQGQTILQRQLNVRPTITIPAGTPVTVFLSQNVSFQTPPQRVRE